MNLRDYLHVNHMTTGQFARELGLESPIYLYRIKNGHKKPGKRLAKDIVAATGGQVTMDELMNAVPYQGKEACCG